MGNGARLRRDKREGARGRKFRTDSSHRAYCRRRQGVSPEDPANRRSELGGAEASSRSKGRILGENGLVLSPLHSKGQVGKESRRREAHGRSISKLEFDMLKDGRNLLTPDPYYAGSAGFVGSTLEALHGDMSTLALPDYVLETLRRCHDGIRNTS